MAGNFIKKEALAQFSCEFFKISKSIFFTERLRAIASAASVIFKSLEEYPII